MPHDPAVVESFFNHALEGMSLSARADDGIHYRDRSAFSGQSKCRCGKRISGNKYFCLTCLTAAIEELAQGVADETTIAMVVRSTTREQRAEIIERLQKLREENGLPRLDNSEQIKAQA